MGTVSDRSNHRRGCMARHAGSDLGRGSGVEVMQGEGQRCGVEWNCCGTAREGGTGGGQQRQEGTGVLSVHIRQ